MPVSGAHRGVFLCNLFTAQRAAVVGSAGHMQPSKVFAAVHFLSVQNEFKFLV